MPTPSHTVRPAGKRYSHGGYVGGADAPGCPVACQGCAGQWPCASGWRCWLPPALKAFNPLGTLTCPASWGDDGHSRAGCPGRRDLPAPGTVAPARGCVRPGRPTARPRWVRVTGVTLARSVRGHSFRAAACCCRRRHGTAPTPALAMTASRRPCRSITVSYICSIWGLDRYVSPYRGAPRSQPGDRVVRSAWRRPVITTLAPWSMNSWAIPRPTPWSAPVMTATFPARGSVQRRDGGAGHSLVSDRLCGGT
jgi:hypothetical protein